MADVRAILSRNIRSGRERYGLRQEDLAGAIGVKTAETISQIERGDREVKARELVEIARALHVDMMDLLSEEGLPPALEPLWRKTDDCEDWEAEAILSERAERFSILTGMVEAASAETLPLYSDFRIEHATYEDAGLLGERVRVDLRLGDVPARTIMDVLEDRYGVLIFCHDMQEGGSGLSARKPYGPVMQLRKSEAPWRRVFSCAHELFHLVTPDATEDGQPVRSSSTCEWADKLAGAFASSLLMPESALRAKLPSSAKRGTLEVLDVVALAMWFGVSTSALLWRLVNLGVVSRETVRDRLEDPEFRIQNQTAISGRAWVPQELPKRFVTLAFIAFKQGLISRARLAAFLETDLVVLPQLLEGYGLDIAIDESYATAGADTRR